MLEPLIAPGGALAGSLLLPDVGNLLHWNAWFSRFTLEPCPHLKSKA
jgi:hypothetical protein